MKRLALAVSVLSVASSAALAADMAVKAPPPPLPVLFSWTGFYIGVNAGGHWGDDRITTTTDPLGGFGVLGAASIDAASPTTLHPQGAVAGGQIGYNWQFNSWLFGLEADADWVDGTATRTIGPIANINVGDRMFNSSKNEFLATFRPRAGVVFNQTLLYVTGGLAVGSLQTTDIMTHFGGAEVTATNNTTTRAGWTVGAGAEFAFLNNWSAKIEYLYVDLGRYDTFIPSSVGGFPDDITVHHKYTDNIVRVGLNYRFGPTAVVARY